jgi:ATP-binding protein involved in chromosome partitioning
MVVPNPTDIRAALAKMGKIIQEITVDEKLIRLRLLYPYPIQRQISQIKQEISDQLLALWPSFSSDIQIQSKIRHHVVQKGLKPKSVIKNIIAVGSGKGGVGKSTVALNLALALQGQGAKVALLDADIYGPSTPRMLGMQATRAVTQDKKLIPVMQYGIQSSSIGYLVDEQNAMIWRGPMVSSALQQLLNETAWTECDYMIIDLPPGTGDIQLTMAQKIPISGAVIVTTPQDISLLDARKAITMFEKVEIPVLGIVENMSWHICQQCGHQSAIFGEGGGMRLAQEVNMPLLAQLPLEREIQAQGDQGKPIIACQPQSPLAAPYWDMALKISEALSLQPVDYAAQMPQIVVES